MKILLPVLLFSISLRAAAEPMMRIRPHMVASPNSEVTLRQVIDANEISESTLKQLDQIILAKTPKLGERLELTNIALMEILRPIVQEERQRTNRQVVLVVPKVVTLDTEKRSLDTDTVTAELIQVWQPLCGDCRLEIEGLSLPRLSDVRDWKLKIKSEVPRGSFSVAIDLIRENGSVSSAWVAGRLINKQKVPVAKRALQIGERVQAADFLWEYRDTSYAVDGAPGPDELIGKQMKRGLRAGEIMWLGALEKEKAIQRGDIVQVVSKASGWEVSLSVIADRDAFVGDTINLKNPKTNSTMIGHVTARGEVELK